MDFFFLSSTSRRVTYNNVNDNRTSWLAVAYKIKILKRDKNVKAEDGVRGAAAPPNVIPKKSPPSLPLDPVLPV